MPDLSICICTLTRRKPLLDRLLRVLRPQLDDNTQLLIREDNGEEVIGEKRNALLDEATGKYVCFIDDDDLVDPEYRRLIQEGIGKGVDVVSINGILRWDGTKQESFEHALKHRDKAVGTIDGVRKLTHPPNHLDPIQRRIITDNSIKFPSADFGEDNNYAVQLFDHLKTEHHIDKPIYFYDYRTQKDYKPRSYAK